MKKSASVAVAAVLLLSGISAASAATAASHMSKGAGGAATAGDTLALSATQQKEIWKDLSRHAANQTAPSGFNATVGAAIPSGISLYPLPRQAARDVPAVKPYRFAMLQDKIVIVNPSDKKIADVVAK
jgi:Protein of unknown function (DUF1236)